MLRAACSFGALRSSFVSSTTSKGAPARSLHVHEYEAFQLLDKFNVKRPAGYVAATTDEAHQIAERLQKERPDQDFVVKAQVLAGGRGKGTFTNGYRGGVHICTSAGEVAEAAKNMFGQVLVTKQTGPQGKPCHHVLVNERLFLRRETYFAILMDRAFGGPVLVGSSEGGMDIEEVAARSPDSIVKEPVDITQGVQQEQLERVAEAIGFDSPKTKSQAVTIFRNLYDLFIKTDATLVEINPLGESALGNTVLCIDTKLNFDDNAEFRHPELFALRDESQMDPREVTASKENLNYIGLDGNIGCLVNGAGLAMATMDCIKLFGGSPANFLDIGGGANERQVVQALKLLQNDPAVRCILVNIFGGIMRCDIIALGLINAASETGLKKPLVVRLAGTNVEEGKKLIEESGLRMVTADDLEDASQKAVRISEIMKMAELAKLKVSFELPL